MLTYVNFILLVAIPNCFKRNEGECEKNLSKQQFQQSAHDKFWRFRELPNSDNSVLLYNCRIHPQLYQTNPNKQSENVHVQEEEVVVSGPSSNVMLWLWPGRFQTLTLPNLYLVLSFLRMWREVVKSSRKLPEARRILAWINWSHTVTQDTSFEVTCQALPVLFMSCRHMIQFYQV